MWRTRRSPSRSYFAEFPAPHNAVVESTGGWYWPADVLAPLGVELVLAHATRLKAISAAKVKTDQVDSDVLALLLRADLIPVAHMIRPAQRGPRDLMRARLRLVEKTLKAGAIRPPRGSLAAQQRAFNTFRREYNDERPHQYLRGRSPGDRYHGSPPPIPNSCPRSSTRGTFS